MVAIITYTTPSYNSLVKRLKPSAENTGLQFIHYKKDWLETTQYYQDNKVILDSPRGGGYWAWKPYIIAETLKKHDKVLYLDASVTFSAYNNVLEFIDKNVFTANGSGYINADWTKRDCFRVMDCDSEKYWKAEQIWAGCVVASREYLWLVEEWQKYCMMDIITDKESTDNFPGFTDHRHDQSILSILFEKYNIKISRETIFLDF